LRVTLIDAVAPGQSCSFGNAACISTSSIIPFSYPGLIKKVPAWLLGPLGPMFIRPRDFPSLVPWFWNFWRASNMQKVEEIASAQASLMKMAFADYEEILSATGSSHLKLARGAIHLFDSEKEYAETRWQIDLQARHGFEQRRLGREELKSLVSGLKLHKGVAVLMPQWHHLIDPARVTEVIAQSCFAGGVSWLQDHVSSVTRGETGICLNTVSGKKINADQLVVAAGAWSNQIAQQLDYKVPMIAKRGYHSQLSEPGIELPCPVMSISRQFVMTPLENGLRIAGTAEFAALDAKPDFRRAKVLLKQASHYLDGLKTDSASEWMGQRPMMSDSLPVISESPGYPGVFYAFGHGHYGLTQGPTTGRIIADMVTGEEPAIDLSVYRFDRFDSSGS
jgi:D-amino-acid dehydrogenase